MSYCPRLCMDCVQHYSAGGVLLLQELLDVAHEERDAARDKVCVHLSFASRQCVSHCAPLFGQEEEYFNTLRQTEDTISTLKKKCV